MSRQRPCSYCGLPTFRRPVAGIVACQLHADLLELEPGRHLPRAGADRDQAELEQGRDSDQPGKRL